MNWRRGFFRLWIIIAVCWVAAVALLAYGHFSDGTIDLSTGWESRATREAAAQLAHEAAVRLERQKPAAPDIGPFEPIVPETFEEMMLDVPNNRDYAVRYAFLAALPFSVLGMGFLVAWIGAGFTRKP